MRLLLLLSTLFLSFEVFAFPTTVRHGYTSCFTCHYSPTGGGVLRPYGKIIAGELYGAFNTSKTELPWIQKVKAEPGEPIEEKFAAQAMVRGVQYHTNNRSSKEQEFKVMQADFEAGYLHKGLYAFVTAGIEGARAEYLKLQDPEAKETDLRVRRYYLGYGTGKYSVRAGKFYADYGVRHPNHNMPTRKQLYFEQGEEPIGVQGHYYFDRFDLALSVFEGDDETGLEERSGSALTLTYKTQSSRSGVSLMQVDSDDESQADEAWSIFTQYGFSHSTYLMAEYANRKATTAFGSTGSRLAFAEFGYEWKKAIIPYLIFTYADFKDLYAESNLSNDVSYGLGVRFYPITHFETILQVTEDRSKIGGGDLNKGESALLMVNAYF
jgi:hypothetical protein